jgi:hypothetical protein
MVMASHLVEVAVWELLTRMSSLNTGTIDQDGDLVPIGQHLRRQLCNIFLRGQVRGVDECLAAQLLYCLFSC